MHQNGVDSLVASSTTIENLKNMPLRQPKFHFADGKLISVQILISVFNFQFQNILDSIQNVIPMSSNKNGM
jgi:hypothetical protein